MKQVTLREANQQFSRLVREVEATGEAVLVLRNGRPAVEIAPSRAVRARRQLSREQQRALEAFFAASRKPPARSGRARSWTRDELHER